MSAPFQPMPELTPDQREALAADIRAHGVLVPILTDQHGRVIDGHNRAEIAAALGIDCPREVRTVADDAEALDLAVTLNCARRHLTREQKREIILAEAERRPDDSDRAIARRVGCSPSTVAAVRRPVSKLDTPAEQPRQAPPEMVAAAVSHIRDTAEHNRAQLREMCALAMRGGATFSQVLTAVVSGNAAELERWRNWGPEVAEVLTTEIHLPFIISLTSEGSRAFLAMEYAEGHDMPPALLSLVLDILAGRRGSWHLDDSPEFAAWCAGSDAA